jgi:hypothetical protein
MGYLRGDLDRGQEVCEFRVILLIDISLDLAHSLHGQDGLDEIATSQQEAIQFEADDSEVQNDLEIELAKQGRLGEPAVRLRRAMSRFERIIVIDGANADSSFAHGRPSGCPARSPLRPHDKRATAGKLISSVDFPGRLYGTMLGPTSGTIPRSRSSKSQRHVARPLPGRRPSIRLRTAPVPPVSGMKPFTRLSGG